MKKTITTIALATILTFGATFANAGILVSDKSAPSPCTSSEPKGLDGIIVAGLDGIIVAGFTGIIVAGVKDTTPVNCGIIVAGKDGILVSD